MLRMPRVTRRKVAKGKERNNMKKSKHHYLHEVKEFKFMNEMNLNFEANTTSSSTTKETG